MAEKRMFSMKICDSDAFLDMPLSSQCLYFHLNMRADDDGFVGNPRRIQKLVGTSEDDLRLLIIKRFLLVFESGVIVIKHWKMHNTIQRDRYKETAYQDEFEQLTTKKNKSYTLKNGSDDDLETICIQNDSTVLGLDIDLDIDLDIHRAVIDYLNLKAGKNFKLVESNKKHINARIKEGFTLDDFKKVIDNKVTEWKNDDKMNQYLRPETLFSSKFQSYLNSEPKQNLNGKRKENVTVYPTQEVEDVDYDQIAQQFANLSGL